MAGVEKHDESFPSENSEAAGDDVVSSEVSTVDESVCTIVPSTNSNEILLYVGDGNNQGVQDLLRVALNQPNLVSASPAETQDGSSKLTLQTLTGNTGHTIISVPVSSIGGNTTINYVQMADEANNQQHQIDNSVVVEHQQSISDNTVEDQSTQVTNVFGLTNLTENVEKEAGQIKAEIEHSIGVDIENVVLKTENDSLLSESFLIANIDPTENEKIPGKLIFKIIFFKYTVKVYKVPTVDKKKINNKDNNFI